MYNLWRQVTPSIFYIIVILINYIYRTLQNIRCGINSLYFALAAHLGEVLQGLQWNAGQIDQHGVTGLILKRSTAHRCLAHLDVGSQCSWTSPVRQCGAFVGHCMVQCWVIVSVSTYVAMELHRNSLYWAR